MWLKPHVIVPAFAVWLVSAVLIGRAAGWRCAFTDALGLLVGGLVAGGLGVLWLVRSGAWPYFVDVFTELEPGVRRPDVGGAARPAVADVRVLPAVEPAAPGGGAAGRRRGVGTRGERPRRRGRCSGAVPRVDAAGTRPAEGDGLRPRPGDAAGDGGAGRPRVGGRVPVPGLVRRRRGRPEPDRQPGRPWPRSTDGSRRCGWSGTRWPTRRCWPVAAVLAGGEFARAARPARAVQRRPLRHPVAGPRRGRAVPADGRAAAWRPRTDLLARQHAPAVPDARPGAVHPVHALRHGVRPAEQGRDDPGRGRGQPAAVRRQRPAADDVPTGGRRPRPGATGEHSLPAWFPRSQRRGLPVEPAGRVPVRAVRRPPGREPRRRGGHPGVGEAGRTRAGREIDR